MIRCSKSPTHLAATAEGSIGVILKAQAKEESIFLETDPTLPFKKNKKQKSARKKRQSA